MTQLPETPRAPRLLADRRTHHAVPPSLSSEPLPEDTARFHAALQPPLSKSGGQPEDATQATREHPAKDAAFPVLPARRPAAGISSQPPLEKTPQTLKKSHDSAVDAPSPVTPGDAILAGLRRDSSPADTGAPSPDAFVGTEIRWVERILASVPAADNNGETAEVRITLKDAVLPDTEIHIRRSGEQLVVLLVTGNERSEQALVPHLRELQTLLAQRFPGEVRVRLESPDMGGNAQGDGRSRQQRDLFYEMASAATRR